MKHDAPMMHEKGSATPVITDFSVAVAVAQSSVVGHAHGVTLGVTHVGVFGVVVLISLTIPIVLWKIVGDCDLAPHFIMALSISAEITVKLNE